jgi:hypothetical protein
MEIANPKTVHCTTPRTRTVAISGVAPVDFNAQYVGRFR